MIATIPVIRHFIGGERDLDERVRYLITSGAVEVFHSMVLREWSNTQSATFFDWSSK